MLATLLMAVAIPDAFGSTGAPLRLLVRGDPGGTARVPDLRLGAAGDDRAEAIRSHSRLALRGRRVLDRGRLRRGRGACGGLARRARHRLPRARSRSTACRAGAQLDPEAWDVETTHFAERFQLFVIIALGESIVLIGVTAAELEIDAARLTRARARVRGYRCSLVAVLRLRRADCATTPGARRQDDVARPRRLHVPPRGADRGHHRVGGRRRARDRPSDRRAARGRGRRARRRAGDLPARARALPSADGRDALLEAAGRGGRVRRRRAVWARCCRASRSPACSSPCSWA